MNNPINKIPNLSKILRYTALYKCTFYRKHQAWNQLREYIADTLQVSDEIKDVVAPFTSKNIDSTTLAFILEDIHFIYEINLLYKDQYGKDYSYKFQGIQQLLSVLKAYKQSLHNIRKITFHLRGDLLANANEESKDYENWNWTKEGYRPPPYVNQNTLTKEVKGRTLLRFIFGALSEHEAQIKEIVKRKEHVQDEDIKKQDRSIRRDAARRFASIFNRYLEDHHINLSKNKKAELLARLLDLKNLVPPQSPSPSYQNSKERYKQTGKNLLKEAS